MRLSREKINRLSHLIFDYLADDDSVEFLKEDNDIRLRIVEVITKEMETDDRVDNIVRQRLGSYSRKVAEGTKEWDVMYQKLHEEEMVKLGRY
ncbi:MAG: DUF507 family protein [Candidatus Schekmanbacteria bacterium]|nr:DUF507 family protein [Candidatus Schekmanbacteria bacterium]